MGITTLVTLMPLISQEVKLIGELNGFFHYDNCFFLLDSSAEIDNFISCSASCPQIFFVFENRDSLRGLEGLKKVQSKNTFMIVALLSSAFDENVKLLKRVKRLQRRDLNMKIGIFFQQFTSMEDIGQLFQWCKNNQIVHVFAATYTDPIDVRSGERSLNVFTFHPFGMLEVINVTSSTTYDDFFPSLSSNFHQHTLRISRFGTIVDQLFWLTAGRAMNASFNLENVYYDELSDYLRNGFDVVPILRTQAQFLLYPMMMLSNDIVVPEAQPYSDFTAYLRTLTSDSFFGYTLVAIAAIVASLTACRYIKQKRIEFVESLLDVVNLLLNDNTSIKYKRLSRAEIFLIAPLTFVGFVIVNGMLSSLQSYVTQPVFQPQIKTLDDLYSSPLPISTMSDYWKDRMIDVVTNRSERNDWSDKIIGMDPDDFLDQINAYNMSTSYLVSSPDATLLLHAQKRLDIRGFYNTGIQIAGKHYTYTVSEKFIFFDRLNEMIHRMNSAGLYQQWVQKFFAFNERIIVENNKKKSIEREEVDTNQFEFPMIIVYGWIASVFVFVMEFLWKTLIHSEWKKRTGPKNVSAYELCKFKWQCVK